MKTQMGEEVGKAEAEARTPPGGPGCGISALTSEEEIATSRLLLVPAGEGDKADSGTGEKTRKRWS